MRTFNPELDHIDPLWKEGRDYQLVCGRGEPCNLTYREARFNTAKSNRFLPWRVAVDEIGTVPVEQGDLCLFLVGADIEQDIPGEWVLMEFLSEEWFAATHQSAGGVKALEEWRKENLQSQIENLVNWQRNNRGVTTQLQWDYYERNPDKLEERNAKIRASSKEFWKNNPELLKLRGQKIAAAKRKNAEARSADRSR